MSDMSDVRVDLEAARALVRWKSCFAHKVAKHARQIAAESGQPARVTLAHFRQAAQVAIRSLSAAIVDGGPTSDDQQAA